MDLKPLHLDVQNEKNDIQCFVDLSKRKYFRMICVRSLDKLPFIIPQLIYYIAIWDNISTSIQLITAPFSLFPLPLPFLISTLICLLSKLAVLSTPTDFVLIMLISIILIPSNSIPSCPALKKTSTNKFKSVFRILMNHNKLATPVKYQYLNYTDSIKDGYTGLFVDNYKDIVRGVTIPNLSKELCGGIQSSWTRIWNRHSCREALRSISFYYLKE